MARERPDAVYAPPAAFELAPAAPVDLGKSTRTAGWMILVECLIFVAFDLVLMPGNTHVSGMIWLALQLVTGVALLCVRHALVRPLAIVFLVVPLTYQLASGADDPKHAAALLFFKVVGLFLFLAPPLLLLVGQPSNLRRKIGTVLFVLVQLLLVIAIAVTARSAGRFMKHAPAATRSAGSGASRPN